MAACPEFSRSRLQSLIEGGAVQLNGVASKPAAKVREGDRIQVAVPAPEPMSLAPEPADLKILYDDEAILVVFKPAGMAVHPGAGTPRGTLAAALLAHCGSLSQIGGVLRPGIVHRLDKGTSGVMVVAKHDQAHRHLSAQFKARTVEKVYTAVCLGLPKPAAGTIKTPIGRDARNRKRMAVVTTGKPALTEYRVTETFGPASSLRIRLHTGRTHQIRVHLTSIRTPLVGDATYGARAIATRAPAAFQPALSGFPRPALHAERLGFDHPITGERLTFEESWPDDIEALTVSLRATGAAIRSKERP